MRSGTSPQPPPAGTAAEEGLGSARFTGVDSQPTVAMREKKGSYEREERDKSSLLGAVLYVENLY